jgi:vacuole morphology and inheritance protein 14
VARGCILLYFNPIFDSLSKLCTDSEASVKNGAELLDRLIKDIVSEKSLFSASKASKSKESLPDSLLVPGSTPGSNSRFFDVKLFIPLLVERIKAISPATRIFLVNWISVLESGPVRKVFLF